ncbi:hypothetical protein SESBI_35406 [Sesbania bispinosa]|nr:hypothetical protein SESBI_35406 [Sesbania bispinosa]
MKDVQQVNSDVDFHGLACEDNGSGGLELCNLYGYEDNMKLCEVPIITVDGETDVGSLIAEMCGRKKIANTKNQKKKRGRPKKKNVCSAKVSEFDSETLLSTLALNQLPSKIAEHVWDIGKVLGVSSVGDDNKFLKILEGMEMRDRKVVGRGDVDDA